MFKEEEIFPHKYHLPIHLIVPWKNTDISKYQQNKIDIAESFTAFHIKAFFWIKPFIIAEQL